MKKIVSIVVILFMLVSGILFLGKNIFDVNRKNETGSDTSISVEEKIVPKLNIEANVLDKSSIAKDEKTFNELYHGDIAFENANPQHTYIIFISLRGENGQFVGPDGAPLEVKKEIILGKKEGKVHVKLTGNKPMLSHIKELKHVKVICDLKEK
ncbi:hypothetical protein [Enterococcus faecalis]|uniref:hypothetical protein n=1 Tax=Enterococcus faecalis TaxID=1351 RepID=UPI0012B4CD8A|nr:hypothetical protein GIR35_13965 [Enterococcus faecalis]